MSYFLSVILNQCSCNANPCDGAETTGEIALISGILLDEWLGRLDIYRSCKLDVDA